MSPLTSEKSVQRFSVFVKQAAGCHSREGFVAIAAKFGVPREYGEAAWSMYKRARRAAALEVPKMMAKVQLLSDHPELRRKLIALR
jgi:hypothetical protein